MEKHEDPYEILGVSYDAEESEIKKAYRKAALKHHPDRQTTEEDKQRSNDIFAKYSAAYDVLTDPVKRYDWKQANATKSSSKSTTKSSSSKASSSNNTKNSSSTQGVPSTPATTKKTCQTSFTCPQSAPPRTTSKNSTSKDDFSYKGHPSTSKVPPPPPPFQESTNTKIPPPPFNRSNSFSSEHSAGQNQDRPSRSYSYVPQSSSSSTKEVLRRSINLKRQQQQQQQQQLQSSSRIFADRQHSQPPMNSTSSRTSTPTRTPRRVTSVYKPSKADGGISTPKSTRLTPRSRLESKSPKPNRNSCFAAMPLHDGVATPATSDPNQKTKINHNVEAGSLKMRRSVSTTSCQRLLQPISQQKQTSVPPRRSRSTSCDRSQASTTNSNSSKPKSFLSFSFRSAVEELQKDTRQSAKPVRRGRKSDRISSKPSTATASSSFGRRSESMSRSTQETKTTQSSKAGVFWFRNHNPQKDESNVKSNTNKRTSLSEKSRRAGLGRSQSVSSILPDKPNSSYSMSPKQLKKMKKAEKKDKAGATATHHLFSSSLLTSPFADKFSRRSSTCTTTTDASSRPSSPDSPPRTPIRRRSTMRGRTSTSTTKIGR